VQENAVNAHTSRMTLNSVCTSGVFTALLGGMSGSRPPVTIVASHAAALTFGPALLVSSRTQTWRRQLIMIRPC